MPILEPTIENTAAFDAEQNSELNLSSGTLRDALAASAPLTEGASQNPAVVLEGRRDQADGNTSSAPPLSEDAFRVRDWR